MSSELSFRLCDFFALCDLCDFFALCAFFAFLGAFLAACLLSASASSALSVSASQLTIVPSVTCLSFFCCALSLALGGSIPLMYRALWFDWKSLGMSSELSFRLFQPVAVQLWCVLCALVCATRGSTGSTFLCAFLCDFLCDFFALCDLCAFFALCAAMKSASSLASRGSTFFA